MKWATFSVWEKTSMAVIDRKIKNVLVKHGILSRDDGSTLFEEAIKVKKPFSEFLIENNHMSEMDLISAICKDSGLAGIDLNKIKFDKAIVNLISNEKAETHNALAISKIGDFLTLAVGDPFDLYNLDDLKKITNCEILPVVTTEYSLKRNINLAYREEEEKLQEFYDELASVGDASVETIEEEEDDDVDISVVTDEESPVVKLVNIIIANALKAGASDIHIEPFERRVRLRYRVDGVCYEKEPTPPKKMQNAVSSRIKIMSELDIAEKRAEKPATAY